MCEQVNRKEERDRQEEKKASGVPHARLLCATKTARDMQDKGLARGQRTARRVTLASGSRPLIWPHVQDLIGRTTMVAQTLQRIAGNSNLSGAALPS